MIFYIGVQKVSKIGTKWRLSVNSDGYVYRRCFDLSSEDFRFSKALILETKSKSGGNQGYLNNLHLSIQRRSSVLRQNHLVNV